METQELQRLKNKYDIIGNDPALNRALDTAVRFAPTDLTVLITGESGVGKENISKIIHQYSTRRNGKFFAVNCGAIPEGTIDSELFGHVKGAYTGAVETRAGYFEEANGGTLFLDEIAELPLASQAKLLRVLQSGEYMKVGSARVEHTDVRVVAATNIDLAYAVRNGRFREDLYYRLDAAQIRMPSLRERKDDIYLLFRKFTSDFSEKYGMCKISLTHDGIELLRSYRWPGNIRQLMNFTHTVTALESQKITPVSERIELDAATLKNYMPTDENAIPVRFAGGEGPSGGEGISGSERQAIFKAIFDLKQEVENLKGDLSALKADTVRHSLPPVSRDHGYGVQPPVRDDAEWQEQAGDLGPEDQEAEDGPDTDDKASRMSWKKTEDELIRRVLDKYDGNRKKAAAELGISERTLYRKLPPEYRKKQ